MFPPANTLVGGYITYTKECIEQLNWFPLHLKLLQYPETGKSPENQNIFTFHPSIPYPGCIPSGTGALDVSFDVIYLLIVPHMFPTSIHASRSSITSQNAQKQQNRHMFDLWQLIYSMESILKVCQTCIGMIDTWILHYTGNPQVYFHVLGWTCMFVQLECTVLYSLIHPTWFFPMYQHST